MKIDIKKVMGESPKNQIEADKKMSDLQQELLSALHIMQSALEFPDMERINTDRMSRFLTKYCEE